MCFAAREIAKKWVPVMQQAAASLEVEKLQKEADDAGINLTPQIHRSFRLHGVCGFGRWMLLGFCWPFLGISQQNVIRHGPAVVSHGFYYQEGSYVRYAACVWN